MTQITLSNLPENILALLKARADSAGRSLEEEARTILERELRIELEAEADRAAMAEYFRKELRGQKTNTAVDSADLVREIRDERTADLS